MDPKEIEFQRRLVATFTEEAGERLKTLSSGLVELERQPGNGELLESLVREAHSIKGAARAVNLADIEALARSIEGALAAVKSGRRASAEDFDLMQRTLDAIGKLVEQDASPALKSAARKLISDLDAMQSGASIAPAPAETPVAVPAVSRDTVRIPAAKLSALLLEAEQFLAVKLAAENLLVNLREAEKDLARIREKQEGVFSRELKGEAASLQARLAATAKSAEDHYRFLSASVGNFLQGIKKVLMLPFSSLVEGFPKLVRDLSRDLGKEVDFVIEGEEMEIDKRILDEMKDPLIHLVRNAIDHGIESPQERVAKGKPSEGKFGIRIFDLDSGKIAIDIWDDGAGIDPRAVREAAVKRNILSREDADRLSEKESLALILRSGVTTSPIVTDLSGRGLGLAIVEEKVDKLNGTLSFESKPGEGSRFRIVLPVTLATFRGVLVGVGGHVFVLPTQNTEVAMRVDAREVRKVENRETIVYLGKVLSLVRLDAALGLTAEKSGEKKVHVLVLSSGAKRMGFLVDSVIGEQEVLVKPLGKQLQRVRNVAGVTVLGSGRLAPILNVHDLFASALALKSASAVSLEEARNEKKSSVLVVEDSITTRVLLKNILEAAGFRVETRANGAEGLTALKNSAFDLVVSDVMMPQMDGFELTRKIRSDKALSRLPVVLVTSLEKKEDRERGIDAGANAYIVKSSFDQGNLLDTVRGLI